MTIFKMMFMCLKVIYLFPDTVNHLRVWIYDSCPWSQLPALHNEKDELSGLPGDPAVSAGWGQSLQIPYTQRYDRVRIRSKPEHPVAQTESRKREQGMVCLFRDWENLGQLLCLRLGSGAQTSQSSAENRTGPKKSIMIHFEIAFGSMWNRLTMTMIMLIMIIICTYSVAFRVHFQRCYKH